MRWKLPCRESRLQPTHPLRQSRFPTAGLPNGEGADSCAAGDWFDKFCDGKTVTVEKLYASSCLRTHKVPPFYSRHKERKRHRPRVQGNFQKGY